MAMGASLELTRESVVRMDATENTPGCDCNVLILVRVSTWRVWLPGHTRNET